MNIFPKLCIFPALAILLFIAAGCEKPALSKKEAPEPEPAPKVEPAPVVSTSPPPPEPKPVSKPKPGPEKVAVKKEEVDVEPTLPEFYGAISGNTIELAGAIKSKFALERMIQDLEREFPDHEIINKVEHDYNRIPVKWSSRLAGQFLVRFFKRVPDGIVSYDSGTVRLTGTMDKPSALYPLQIAANETFQDTYTVEIQNELVSETDDLSAPRPRK